MGSAKMDEAPVATRGINRRTFLILAGTVAGVGALFLATRGKALQGLLQRPQTTQPPVVRGRNVGSAAPAMNASLLSRLLGKKL